MHRGFFAIVILLAIVILIIPAVLVSIQAKSSTNPSGEQDSQTDPEIVELKIDADAIEVPVYLTQEKRVIKLPLERYIRGVIAAEMPADFALEALKAQALAARTYIIDRMTRGNFSDMVDTYGEKAEGAWVSDTVQHQVFLTDAQLQENWGPADSRLYRDNSNRINEAVNQTRGKVITYSGQPIYAAFFSTSNGKTENSEDYWQDAYPYLRSVDSSWDRQAPSYDGEPVVISLDTFASKLEKQTDKSIAIPANTGSGEWIRILGKTEGDNIAKIQIGDQTFSGREVREALGLRSSDFSWTIDKGRIVLTTRGYGHGVGMSQWGANLMAQDGKSAKQIITHYYQDVQVEDYQQWVKGHTDQPEKNS